MATPTYTLIDSVTLGSSAASVTFSSLNTIAAGYRDVIIVVDASATAGSNNFLGKVNADTSNHSVVLMSGNGSSAASTSYANQGAFFLNYSDTVTTGRYQATLQFFDIHQTDKHKSMLYRLNNAANGVTSGAGRWGSTSAITSIEVYVPANAFASGSTFFIYGIEA